MFFVCLDHCRVPTGQETATEPSTSKKALITGITGQDRSYLVELFPEKGYEVHGRTLASIPLPPNKVLIGNCYENQKIH